VLERAEDRDEEEQRVEGADGVGHQVRLEPVAEPPRDRGRGPRGACGPLGRERVLDRAAKIRRRAGALDQRQTAHDLARLLHVKAADRTHAEV
jgi:hypothetical protein